MDVDNFRLIFVASWTLSALAFTIVVMSWLSGATR
jgi:hypothetical protein